MKQSHNFPILFLKIHFILQNYDTVKFELLQQKIYDRKALFQVKTLQFHVSQYFMWNYMKLTNLRGKNHNLSQKVTILQNLRFYHQNLLFTTKGCNFAKFAKWTWVKD